MPTVETNSIETYYERRGSGRPIVFVHGAILDHAQWDPQVTALEDEYETVAYDVRGHGRTGGSDRRPYSIDLFAEDLAVLISALDPEDPVVCGHSTGAVSPRRTPRGSNGSRDSCWRTRSPPNCTTGWSGSSGSPCSVRSCRSSASWTTGASSGGWCGSTSASPARRRAATTGRSGGSGTGGRR